MADTNLLPPSKRFSAAWQKRLARFGKRTSWIATTTLLASLLAVTVEAAHAQAEADAPEPGTTLSRRIAGLVTAPEVRRAHWGIAVTTLDGRPLYSLNADQFFRPASSAKLFTTAAALALLGSDATVTTTVTSDGTLDADGTLHGDLVLHGAGDANLSGRILPYESPAARKTRLAALGPAAPPENPLAALDDLAAQVAAKGVRRIEGTVVGDDTLWPEQPFAEAWGADDLPWGYGAPVSALAVNDNQWELKLTPGPAVGSPAHAALAGSPAWLTVQDASLVTGPKSSPTRVLVDQEPSLAVRGSIPLEHTDTQEIALRQPATLAAAAFAERLKGAGVPASGASGAERTLSLDTNATPGGSVAGAATFTASTSPLPGASALVTNRSSNAYVATPCTAPCRILATRTSPTLATDVVVTLKTSQNLHAEMMLKRLGKQFGPDGTFEAGAKVVRDFLTGQAHLDPAEFAFVDGSGLSTHDLVSPHATVSLLSFAATQPWFKDWFAGLPVGGIDGTLSARFTDPTLKGHVFAKTGTLSESRALAGFLDTHSGRRIAFAIYVDDHQPGSSADRIAMDRIVAAIAAAL